MITDSAMVELINSMGSRKDIKFPVETEYQMTYPRHTDQLRDALKASGLVYAEINANNINNEKKFVVAAHNMKELGILAGIHMGVEILKLQIVALHNQYENLKIERENRVRKMTFRKPLPKVSVLSHAEIEESVFSKYPTRLMV
jgi:hypothetical protein